MKTRKFALFAFALLVLGVTAQKAQAQTYTCDGGSNPVPAMVTGSAVVQQTGNCSIAAGIIATGTIDITVTGGTLTVGAGLQGTAVTASTSAASDDITTQAITATSGGVSVTSGGKVTTTNLTSTPADILISAPGNVSTNVISAGSNFGVFTQTGTGTIKITGTVTTGTVGAGNVLLQSNGNIDVTSNITAGNAVEIDANMNQATSTVFKIGASSSNGVGGTIKAPMGVFVVNGNTSATGGLTITNGNKINIATSAAASGGILLNAQNGTLTLSAGKLTADGATGQPARLIVLLANNVTTGASTTITASQANSVAGSIHYVAVAANTLTVGGTTIEANGNGLSTAAALVEMGPPGYIAFTSNEDVDFLLWNVIPGSTNLFTNNLPFTVNGAGALTVNANSSTNNSEIAIGGYPIAFSNAGNVTLQSKGNGTFSAPHLIQLGYLGTLNGTPGLTFNNTGTVLIDASGSSGNNAGGQIQIQLDQFSIASSVTSFTMHADGLGTGNAGIVAFFPSKATFSDATTLITANGAGSTSVSSPNINFGVSGATAVNSTTFTVSANALASANKNAGIVTFSSNPITLASNTAASITANGPTSANGAGGTITLNPAFLGTLKLGGNPGDLSLSAKGGAGTGTGNNGGTIIVNNAPAITLDTAQATALNVSVPGATGNGGTINISNSGLTVNGSGYALSANAGTSQGNGGNITINGAATVIGTGAGALVISANATGTGNGGQISVTAQPLTVSGSSISANAGSTNGNGGTITLNSNGGTRILTLSGTLAVNGKGNGNGGQISLTGSQSVATDGTAAVMITANAVGSGNGGSITVTSTNGNVSIGTSNSSFELSANATASGTGKGGTIEITAPGMVVAGGNINVTAGASGDGGTIDLTATSSGGNLEIDGALNASAGSTQGTGGNVTITADNTLTSTTGLTITASGSGSGQGGMIDVDSVQDLTVSGTGANTFNLDAHSTGTGNGGTVIVASNASITIAGANINVAPGTNGVGGNVTAEAGNSLTVAGTINAAGNGTGNGGTITLTAASSSGLTITGSSTIITADSGNGGGNTGGTVSITNSLGDVTISNGANLSAQAAGLNGNGGTISVTAGSGSANANLHISSSNTAIRADSGAAGGNGGTINLKYTDTTGSGAVFISNAPITADTVSGGAGGSVNISNTSASGGIVVDQTEGELSAMNGVVSFNAPSSQPVTVISTETLGVVAPIVGAVNASGSTVSITQTINEPFPLTLGTINATSVTLTMNSSGMGNIDAVDNSLITAQTLTFGGNFNQAGVSNDILTNIQTLSMTSGAAITQFALDNTGTSNLTVSDGWSVVTLFSVISDGAVSVGNITQTGPTGTGSDFGIGITSNGTLTVRSSKEVNAQSGNVILTADGLTSTLVVEAGAQIVAESNTNTLIGNVVLQVAPGSVVPQDCRQGDVPNVNVSPVTATYSCGPNLFTANPPSNGLTLTNRSISILGPAVGSIVLDGSTIINALGTH